MEETKMDPTNSCREHQIQQLRASRTQLVKKVGFFTAPHCRCGGPSWYQLGVDILLILAVVAAVKIALIPMVGICLMVMCMFDRTIKHLAQTIESLVKPGIVQKLATIDQRLETHCSRCDEVQTLAHDTCTHCHAPLLLPPPPHR